MSESAVAAAVAVAGEYGLHADDPVVLRDAWHVLLHLRPQPLVARVSSGRRSLRAIHEAPADYGASCPSCMRTNRAAWMYASFMPALPRRPELEPVLDERLRWLRATYA